jgi:hypothetical protein
MASVDVTLDVSISIGSTVLLAAFGVAFEQVVEFSGCFTLTSLALVP